LRRRSPWAAEGFARLKEWREIKALRASLAAEIRLYVELPIKTREILKTIEPQFGPGEQQNKQGDLRDLAALHPPTVYPAAAERSGGLGNARALPSRRVLRDRRTAQFLDEGGDERADEAGCGDEL
jgi:hypothetical protein